MEGTKLHHDVPSSNDKLPPPDKSLSDFLSSLGSSNPGSDDYYDVVEQSRSKNRNNNNNLDQLDVISDDLSNSASYDPNALLDDYTGGGSDSLLLAAEFAKLNKKNGNSGSNLGGNSNKNPFLDKIKAKLNNLMPQTISSKFIRI